jgi:hypothetical protein
LIPVDCRADYQAMLEERAYELMARLCYRIIRGEATGFMNMAWFDQEGGEPPRRGSALGKQ